MICKRPARPQRPLTSEHEYAAIFHLSPPSSPPAQEEPRKGLCREGAGSAPPFPALRWKLAVTQ